MTSSRSEMRAEKKDGGLWMTRTYYPTPHSDMFATTDYILKISEDERGLSKGRFRFFTHVEQEHRSELLLNPYYEEKRSHDLDNILHWLCEVGEPWSFVFSDGPALKILFSFPSKQTAYLFMMYFAWTHD